MAIKITVETWEFDDPEFEEVADDLALGEDMCPYLIRIAAELGISYEEAKEQGYRAFKTDLEELGEDNNGQGDTAIG